MNEYNYKIDEFMLKELTNIKNPTFLEFGVKEGRSTKKFLELCEKNNGNLISVDVDDYKNLSSSPKWKFIHTRDDNFEEVEKHIHNQLDLIYLDSLHEANHVKKILFHYYKYLKVGGYFFIDDISWLPYLKNQTRDNFYCEINNKETFDKLVEIYLCNKNKFDISFSFISSGICRIKKLNENLIEPDKIETRETSFKNIIRRIVGKLKN